MYDYRNNEICAKHQRDQTKDYDGIARLVEKRKSDILGVDAPFMVAVALKDTDEMVGEIVVMPEDGTSPWAILSHSATTEKAMFTKVYQPS